MYLEDSHNLFNGQELKENAKVYTKQGQIKGTGEANGVVATGKNNGGAGKRYGHFEHEMSKIVACIAVRQLTRVEV